MLFSPIPIYFKLTRFPSSVGTSPVRLLPPMNISEMISMRTLDSRRNKSSTHYNTIYFASIQYNISTMRNSYLYPDIPDLLCFQEQMALALLTDCFLSRYNKQQQEHDTTFQKSVSMKMYKVIILLQDEFDTKINNLPVPSTVNFFSFPSSSGIGPENCSSSINQM